MSSTGSSAAATIAAASASSSARALSPTSSRSAASIRAGRCSTPPTPSRASAIRELLKRGLAAEGFEFSEAAVRSKDYGVTAGASKKPRRMAGNGADGARPPRGKNG